MDRTHTESEDGRSTVRQHSMERLLSNKSTSFRYFTAAIQREGSAVSVMYLINGRFLPFSSIKSMRGVREGEGV